MLNYFNTRESEIATGLVNIALAHSAKAFTDFVKKTVSINAVNLDDQEILATTMGEPVYALISELKGELRGKCYLNFSYADASMLCCECLPEKYHGDMVMYEAILMELDNILTAAVVTMMSDILKVNAYAYVPELKILTTHELNKLLEHDYDSDKLVLHFKAGFKIAGMGVSSEFIWVMDLMLADAISRFAQTEDHRQILGKLKQDSHYIDT